MNNDVAYEMRIVRSMLQKRKQQLDSIIAASKNMLSEFRQYEMNSHQRLSFDEVEREIKSIEADSL